MKNWSNTKKIVVALIIIAIIAIIWNWDAVAKQLGIKSDDGKGTTTKQRGGCVKHVGSNGSTWYTYGGIEVQKQDCIDRGYL